MKASELERFIEKLGKKGSVLGLESMLALLERMENPHLEHNTIPVKTLDGKTVFYCGDCLAHGVEWCDRCQEAFELNPNDYGECDYVDDKGNILVLCPECRKEPEKINAVKRQ